MVMKLTGKPLKESQHQTLLFKWAKTHPICKDFLIAIPNGMWTHNIIQAVVMKAQGLRPGVSDMFLAYPVEGGWKQPDEFHGLWIELKKDKKGKPSLLQIEWLERMREVGYAAELAYGWEHAKEIILEYLDSGESIQNNAPDS